MCFLAGSYSHIPFSRILFGPVATFFLCLSVYFLLRGLLEAKAFWTALAGFGAGFGMLTYYSSRLAPLLFLPAFSSWMLEKRPLVLEKRPVFSLPPPEVLLRSVP